MARGRRSNIRFDADPQQRSFAPLLRAGQAGRFAARSTQRCVGIVPEFCRAMPEWYAAVA